MTIAHDGVVGRGEAAPSPYYRQSLESVEEVLEQAEPMLGDDPGDIDAIVDRLLERFDDQRAAVAAIDEALHDLWGRRAGQPVWRLLGVDAAATPATSMSIGIDALELLPQKVADAADFHILKLKVGTADDRATLQTVRRLAPSKLVRVDANCGWSADEAVTRIRALEPFELELIEQPIPAGQFDAVRSIREQAAVPLIADEDSVRPADVPLLAGVYDGINIKLSKCGGIREARRMIESARAHDLRIMLGCMVETSLGIAAAAQLAALVDYVDLDGHLLLADDPYCGLILSDGIVRPGDGPGLSVRPVAESCDEMGD